MAGRAPPPAVFGDQRPPLSQSQQSCESAYPSASSPSSSSMTGYHIRARANNLLSSGSSYLATRDWQGMASNLRQKVSDLSQPTYTQSASPGPSQSRSMTSLSLRPQLDRLNSGTTPSQRQNSRQASTAKFRPGKDTPVLLPGWAQRKVARDRHPQTWTSIDAPEDLEDGEIELTIALDGFVSRIADSPSKSQRLFNQMARQLAGLPKLPEPVSSHVLGSDVALTEEPLDISPGGLSPSEPEPGHKLSDKAIGKLVEEADERTLVKLIETMGALPTDSSSAKAAQKLESSDHTDPPSRSTTQKPAFSQRLNIPKTGNHPSSFSSMPSPTTSSTLGGSLYWNSRSFDELHQLHANLNQRLKSYWVYRSAGVDVRIEVAPVIRGAVAQNEAGERILLAATRLTTDSTGQFSHRLVVPWHMLSSFCAFHTSSLQAQPHDIEAIEVRASLAPSQDVSNATTEFTEPLGATQWARYQLEEDGNRKVRIISDIDDTVKHTGVLHGVKRVLRNVFVLPYHECEVPGVSRWYHAMTKAGAGLHYVTNAPLELHYLVSDFLAAVKLPIAHTTLKHYPSGTRTLLSSWLEPAGERKRANVTKVLDEFKESQFILIGDSGELDLELYSALAAERPRQVRGIFIRDVSSPRPGLSRTSTASSTSSTIKTAKARDATSKAVNTGDALIKPPAAAALSQPSSGVGYFEPSYPPPNTAKALTTDFPGMSALDDRSDSSMSETDMRKKQAFQSRVLRATSLIPRSTIFRLFWEGGDVEAEALQLIRELQSGTRPADRS